MSSLTRRRAVLAGLAAGGMMVGHWAAYAVRAPDAGARAVLLEATGHRVLPQLTVLGLLAGAVALLAVPLGAGRAAARLSWSEAARTLVMLQTAGFVLLETSERALRGGGHLHAEAGVFDAPVLLGLAAQVAVGCAAAALLALAGRLTVTARPGLPVPGWPFRLPHAFVPPRPTGRRPGRDSHALRGPPVLSRL